MVTPSGLDRVPRLGLQATLARFTCRPSKLRACRPEQRLFLPPRRSRSDRLTLQPASAAGGNPRCGSPLVRAPPSLQSRYCRSSSLRPIRPASAVEASFCRLVFHRCGAYRTASTMISLRISFVIEAISPAPRSRNTKEISIPALRCVPSADPVYFAPNDTNAAPARRGFE